VGITHIDPERFASLIDYPGELESTVASPLGRGCCPRRAGMEGDAGDP
jgi:hypothetical protein